jgi:ATP-binding cassette subfamily C protein CydC
VRSFALLRIGASYGERLVQHAAVLRLLGWTRLEFFTKAARTASRRGRPLRDGTVLDQALNDTETESMALITVISPLTVFLVTGAMSVAVIALASPAAGVVMAAAGLASLVLSLRASRDRDRDAGDDLVRAATRAELVTAIDAWPELVSLGAAGRLAERSTEVVARLAAEQARLNRRAMKSRTITAVLTALALALAAWAAVFIDHVGAPGVALVLLLGTGMLGVATRTGQAFDALAEVRAARARRAAVGATEIDSPLPDISVECDDSGMRFDGYSLPENTFRAGQRVLSGHIPRGAALVVTGPSGSGKTTFLDALGEALGDAAVLVPVDDHLFTGTIASNLRLARPDAEDDELVEILDRMQLSAAGIHPSTAVGVGGRALSGGEQTRLRLARAVLAGPRVFIADEPTAGLDESTAHSVLQTLRNCLPNAVIVLSLHSVDQLTADALGDLDVIRFD